MSFKCLTNVLQMSYKCLTNILQMSYKCYAVEYDEECLDHGLAAWVVLHLLSVCNKSPHSNCAMCIWLIVKSTHLSIHLRKYSLKATIYKWEHKETQKFHQILSPSALIVTTEQFYNFTFSVMSCFKTSKIWRKIGVVHHWRSCFQVAQVSSHNASTYRSTTLTTCVSFKIQDSSL